MKVYVDGLINKQKLMNFIKEQKDGLSLLRLGRFLDNCGIEKPVEDRYDRFHKFIDWNSSATGWTNKYLDLIVIYEDSSWEYESTTFDFPPITEVERVQSTIEGEHTVSEPDYMLADETVDIPRVAYLTIKDIAKLLKGEEIKQFDISIRFKEE